MGKGQYSSDARGDEERSYEQEGKGYILLTREREGNHRVFRPQLFNHSTHVHQRPMDLGTGGITI